MLEEEIKLQQKWEHLQRSLSEANDLHSQMRKSDLINNLLTTGG